MHHDSGTASLTCWNAASRGDAAVFYQEYVPVADDLWENPLTS